MNNPEPAGASVAPRSAADDPTTRFLLRCGILVGPFYLLLGVSQALLREGFDFGRHPLSVLANGAGGWIQTANFLISGAMVLAVAVGFRRVLGRASPATGWFVGGFGASMIVAAAFPADPVDGFPVGTPPGFPTSISTTGLVHFAAGALGFTSLAVACLVAARALARRGHRLLSLGSVGSGLAILIGFFGGAATGSAGIAGIWLAVVVEFAWLAVVSLHLLRVTASNEP